MFESLGEKLNNAFKKYQSETLGYTEDPIVSSDIIGDTHGGVVDGLLTDVLETEKEELEDINNMEDFDDLPF